MHIKTTVMALILCLSAMGTPAGAFPMEDKNPCDPANGKYICDGTEDQPIGAGPRKGAKPTLPTTGVSDLDDADVAMIRR